MTIIYDIWFLRYGAQQKEFFVFLHYFLHFYPLPPRSAHNNPWNQIFKKIKKPLCYTVPDILLVMNVIFIFCFGYFLPIYPAKCRKNQNFLNEWNKMPGDIITLHIRAKNYGQMMYSSWDMACDSRIDRRRDGQTVEWKKWHIEVDVLPKNLKKGTSDFRNPYVHRKFKLLLTKQIFEKN